MTHVGAHRSRRGASEESLLREHYHVPASNELQHHSLVAIAAQYDGAAQWWLPAVRHRTLHEVPLPLVSTCQLQ